MGEIIRLNIPDWIVKARIPSGQGPHPILLMLHGWQGDEDVMWVFAQKIPDSYLVLAPRGIVSAPNGGYGWANRPQTGLSPIESFDQGVNALEDLLALRPGAPNQVFNEVVLMGFSQGAALAYSFALRHPNRVISILGLAGFLPNGISPFVADRPFLGKPVFMSHGTLDDVIPIERARQDASLLSEAGAQVTLCESEVGHKLGVNCLKGLGHFLVEDKG